MIFNKKISETAYAKINLYLDVISKRTDGFHEIRSIMQGVSLSDTLNISISANREDLLTCNIPGIPTDGKNIALKAANAFRNYVDADFGVNIHIEKFIPSSAGLGGGSSDGAAVIRALNTLTEFGLSDDDLIKIAASVGADIPFCLFSGTYLCEGKGEKLKKLDRCPEIHCVIAIKGDGVSTPWAYGRLDDIYGAFEGERDTGRLPELLSSLKNSKRDGIYENLFNIFEVTVDGARPEVSTLKEILRSNGAKAAIMSGSGPSVFGLFKDEASARGALCRLKGYGADAFYCKTI